MSLGFFPWFMEKKSRMHGEDHEAEACDFSKIKWKVTLIDFLEKLWS